MTTKDLAVGLDIGGTEIGVAVVAAGGRLLHRTAIATESERGFPDALSRVEAAVRQSIGAVGGEPNRLAGIGIGCAGPVDPSRGTINNLFSLAEWMGGDIVSPLRSVFGTSVWLENDADVAALGEWDAGDDPPQRGRLLMLTLGTGIGGGVVIDGEIYRGAGGEHPEIGHVVVADDGPECFCGRRGCLESLASGTAIGVMGRQSSIGDSRAVFAAAAEGHPEAQSIVDRATLAMANAGWTLLHTFLPERIVLSGGIAEQHFDLFAAAMREQIAPATLFPRDKVTILKATLGNDAGVIGGGMLAFSRVP